MTGSRPSVQPLGNSEREGIEASFTAQRPFAEPWAALWRGDRDASEAGGLLYPEQARRQQGCSPRHGVWGAGGQGCGRVTVGRLSSLAETGQSEARSPPSPPRSDLTRVA